MPPRVSDPRLLVALCLLFAAGAFAYAFMGLPGSRFGAQVLGGNTGACCVAPGPGAQCQSSATDVSCQQFAAAGGFFMRYGTEDPAAVDDVCTAACSGAQGPPGGGSSSGGSSSGGMCKPAKVLFYNLQSGYTPNNAQGTILKNAGYDVTIATRETMPTITFSTLQKYSVVWFFNGCNGGVGMPSEEESDAIKSYYLGGGNMVLSVDSSVGDATQGPGPCFWRINERISYNLGVIFKGYVDRTASQCWNVNGTHPILSTGAKQVQANADANITLQGDVTWGDTAPEIVGTLADGHPALAFTKPESGHGGVVYVPNEATFGPSCSQSMKIVENMFGAFGYRKTCPGSSSSGGSSSGGSSSGGSSSGGSSSGGSSSGGSSSGGSSSGGSSSNRSSSPLCGNHRLDSGEECDDGNTIDGDYCNRYCEVEPEYCSGG